MKNRRQWLRAGMLVIAGLVGPANWAIAQAQPSPYQGTFAERGYLTGDWLGTRTALADQGLDFRVSATQFYQGVAAGGQEQAFEWGGKLDYFGNLDGGKLGLQEGLFVNLHAETRLGDSVNNIDGLLTPSNIAMQFPEADSHVTAITGLKITQALSENFAVYLGKINTLDDYALQFAGGPGLAGFMNTSLVFNPIGARTVPYSAVGTGFAVLRDFKPLFTFTVFDPQERAAEGLDNLFERGVLLVPDFQFRVAPWDMPGVYNFGGTWSSAEYRSTDPASYLFVPGIGVLGGRETGSWSLYSNGYQSLWVADDDPTRTWGVFFQSGLSDANPNPIRYVLNGGFGGRSPLRSRTLDTFGVGYFYIGLSDSFKALAAPILPQRDEHGVELFYNYAVTPWCRLTGDLQVAEPSTRAADTVIIPGMRMQMIF